MSGHKKWTDIEHKATSLELEKARAAVDAQTGMPYWQIQVFSLADRVPVWLREQACSYESH